MNSRANLNKIAITIRWLDVNGMEKEPVIGILSYAPIFSTSSFWMLLPVISAIGTHKHKNRHIHKNALTISNSYSIVFVSLFGSQSPVTIDSAINGINVINGREPTEICVQVCIALYRCCSSVHTHTVTLMCPHGVIGVI